MKNGVLIVFLSAGFCSPWAHAAEHIGSTFGFVLENDVFYGRDEHYTNGIQINWVPERSADVPGWAKSLTEMVPWFPNNQKIHHGYAFGQSMFTPDDIELTDPPEKNRPYAGWLYGSIGMGTKSDSGLDLLGLTVGMVGPASLAEHSQKLIHRLIGSDEPKGWRTQLNNEPGVILTTQKIWREGSKISVSGYQLDVSPHIGALLGNIYTYANAGLTLRYGKKLPNDFGPVFIAPSIPGASGFMPSKLRSWYLFAGFEGRVVGRNIFLDGNTFSDSRSVDKKVLVGDIQFGLVVDWRKIRFSYKHLFRSEEYISQGGYDQYGALSVAVKF